MLAVMSIAGIVVYTSLGRTSNDSGRVALRSTKIPLKNSAASNPVPPITLFGNYEICPAYFEDRTDYACGDTTCYVGQSCHQDGSTEYHLVSSPGDYCASVGLEAITTPEECAAAGTVLNGSALPGVNRTFQTCNESAYGCPDLTDYQAGNPCWITGTSGSLKFSDLYLNGTAGVTCGTVDPYDSLSSPSACICKETEDPYCDVAQCQQPDNMTEFFTQVLIQHYGLNNVDNLDVSEGGYFTYEFRNHTFLGTRSDLLQCDGQTERLAVFRACQCENGLASLHCDGESHVCEMCSSGFTMNDASSCSPNQCDCTNGQAAAGANCTDDGAVKCMGCDAGFRLENELCVSNTCFCNNGTTVTGAQCIQDGAERCTECNAGFRLENELCVSNSCFCNNGTAVSGAQCIEDGMFMCASCADGFNMLDDGTCILDECDCTNGQGATGANCEGYGATKCVSCNAGFRLENERCEENTCSCNNGTPANGTQCIEDGAEICSGCESGYSLEFGKCKPNVCYCDAGSNATGSECLEHGSAACSDCQTGYTLNNGSCVMHVCSCNYGMEAHGTECPNNNEPKCISCNPGLVLDANNACVCDTGFHMNENGTCSPNQCICPDVNGIPATGADCPDDGAVKCSGCEDDFRLENEACVPNTCSCNNGTAATGAQCTQDGAEICTDCVSDFSLNDDGICLPNQCICPDGIPATGADCPDDGAVKCSGCEDGWHIEGSECFMNECTCGYGDGTIGTSCPVDGQSICARCDECYRLNDDLKCVSRLVCWSSTCHPSDATVVVQHACDTGLCLARRRMDELNIGDTVESEVGIFEPVLAFLHRDGDAKGEFLSFEFVNNSMEISGNHYMYANGMRVLPGTVKIGDVLSNGETIKDIKQVSKAGLFHPITLSTKLMVNGVQVSTNFEWGGIDVSYIENIFGWVAKALYTIGMPIDVAEDTLWAPLMTVRDNWSSGSQQILNYLPKTLHPVGIVLGGLLLLGYVFPQTALFALITMATFKVKKNKLI